MIGTGMPTTIRLEQFGELVREAFPGCDVYLVGTAATSKTWRDVDVRCLLSERLYVRYVGEPGERLTLVERTVDGKPADYYAEEANASAWPVGKRRTALTLAFAALAREMTGLPVDFQFQTVKHANTRYSGARVPLGLRVRRAR